jgi:hypothetical protein
MEKIIHGAWSTPEHTITASSVSLADATMRSMMFAKAAATAIYAAVLVSVICIGAFAGCKLYNHYQQMQKSWNDHAMNMGDHEYSIADEPWLPASGTPPLSDKIRA